MMLVSPANESALMYATATSLEILPNLECNLFLFFLLVLEWLGVWKILNHLPVLGG